MYIYMICFSFFISSSLLLRTSANVPMHLHFEKKTTLSIFTNQQLSACRTICVFFPVLLIHFNHFHCGSIHFPCVS
uniref:Putative secreted protein n=1 Tax=Anopheles marajoara TaxID=58244 RepID=A0A2M4CCS0_9DIPT